MIKAVAFDLDGTFYPYSRLFFNSLYLALRYPHFIMRFSRVRSEIRKMRPIEDFRRYQARLLAERMAISLSESERLIENIIYQRLVNSFRRVRPFSFLKTTLNRLKEMGLKMAVLSDFPVERKLAFLGLEGFWDCVLCTEDTNYLKPNPEPFLAMAECLDLPPGKILYVGDKYHYDIIGAYRIGMKTAHLARFPESNGKADFTFHSYKNFGKLIIKLGYR